MGFWLEVEDAISFLTLFIGTKYIWDCDFFDIFFWLGLFLMVVGITGIRSVAVKRYKQKSIEQKIKQEAILL